MVLGMRPGRFSGMCSIFFAAKNVPFFGSFRLIICKFPGK